MLKSTLLTAFAFAAMTISAWAGSPSGTFNVSGANPDGGGKYVGSVTITPTGDTFKVVWTIGQDKFYGTGLWVDEKFCVGYASGGVASIAVYTDQGDGTWFGHWANGNDTKSSTETWTPRK